LEIETVFFIVGFSAFIFSFLFHSFGAALNRANFYKFGRFSCYAGAALATCGLALRWYAAGHPPLSNMYESLFTLTTFFAWITLLFTRAEAMPIVETGAAVTAILLTGTASIFAKEIKPLIPALRSYWLHLHVSIAFLGEACFALAFVLSYLFFARKLIEGSERISETSSDSASSGSQKAVCFAVVFGIPALFFGILVYILHRLTQDPADGTQLKALLFWLFFPSVIFSVVIVSAFFLFRGMLGKNIDPWLPSLHRLDELTYRAIALGYPLFTVGAIIFGMVWANKAWGRYWGWDPKETWALITFLVYSGYLHLRLNRGWRGILTSLLSVIGFLVTLFTLFGVNLLLAGLHSYATM